MNSINSPEAIEALAHLEQTVIDEWEDPDDFRLMLSVAASDAGMSDENLGEWGKRVEQEVQETAEE